MAHARFAIFTLKAGHAREVVDKAERELLPVFQQQPGFLAYTLAHSGEDTVLSFSMWNTRSDAEAGNRASSSWVQENLRNKIVSVERHIGEVAFSCPSTELHFPVD